ncbi:MAG: hypothetical protein ACI94Y_004116, partial [Maribacter sp.]
EVFLCQVIKLNGILQKRDTTMNYTTFHFIPTLIQKAKTKGCLRNIDADVIQEIHTFPILND